MAKIPCIQVPSPKEIHKRFFPNGVKRPVKLPTSWSANVLLTPGDDRELACARIMVGKGAEGQRLMRVQMFLIESLHYHDLFFVTEKEQTKWWYIVSNPSSIEEQPKDIYGPFDCHSHVPADNFLKTNGFSHVGSWSVHGKASNAYAAKRASQYPDASSTASWYWHESASNKLIRIMNTHNLHKYYVAIIGAYYLIDFTNFKITPRLNLRELQCRCQQAIKGSNTPSRMRTLADILGTLSNPPSGYQTPCNADQIAAIMPGLSFTNQPQTSPRWTDQVQSEMVMLDQDLDPTYCQVWYDWAYGCQVTVQVYGDLRIDYFMPKEKLGHRVYYNWDGKKWVPSCYDAGRPNYDVAMPVPDFVEKGEGRCRGVFRGSRDFGDMSIWSVDLSAPQTFWFWFNSQGQGVTFALSNTGSLTLIDYQTFLQKLVIKPCVFLDLTSDLKPCPDVTIDRRFSSAFYPPIPVKSA